MLFVRRSQQPVIKLEKIGNNYYIEDICQVNIVSDSTTLGIRLIQLRSLNSKRTHFFKVCSFDKRKNIDKKPIKGIILQHKIID